MSRPKKNPAISAAEKRVRQFGREMKDVARTYEADIKLIAASLPQLPMSELSVAGIRILEPGEKLTRLSHVHDRAAVSSELAVRLSKTDRQNHKFILWKWRQLQRADQKRGVEPSTKTLLNRFNWICETAVLLAVKRSRRKLDKLNVW